MSAAIAASKKSKKWQEAAAKVDADKLYPCTNCGMAPLSRTIARAKLEALSAGAAIVRQELSV